VKALWVAAVLVTSSPAVAEIAADRIEQARGRALTEDFQPALPGGEGSAAPSEGPRKGTTHVQIDTREQHDVEVGPLGTVINWVMWAAVAVAIGLLAFWLATELARFGGDDAALTEDVAGPEAGPDLRVIERPLGDAEELARRGDFTEAVHTLLLRTLQELVRSAAVRVSPALTSREILARVPLAPAAREALADLITAVELTHFRGTTATQDDYARCRDEFQVFAAAFRAGGARKGAA
jgi:hypothetical protein